MKTKRALYLAIIIGLLASMGAIPVLAEEGDTRCGSTVPG